MRSWLAGFKWVGFAMLLAAATGCGQKPSDGPAAGPASGAGPGGGASAAGGAGGGGGQGKLFGVSFQTMNNPFFVDLNDGLKKVIEGHGDRLVTLDAQFNSLKQKNDISDVLQQQPAAFFINPVNWEGIKGSLIEARRRNVPVIVVDAPVSDPDLVLCQVASDNVEAGRLACEALAKANPNAKVVILAYSVNKACIDRVEGFRAEAAKHAGLRILDTQDVKGTTEAARPVMRDMLGRFPDLDAVFPINDPGALGCISAIESAGKLGQVKVVTVDGSREGVAAIQAGKLFSTSAQFPKEIGRRAAEKAYEQLAGKAVEKEVKIPVKLITKENAEEFLKSN
jgi:ribose transport system substrate-binding protein